MGSCRAGACWLEAMLEQMSKVSALWWVGIQGSSHTGGTLEEAEMLEAKAELGPALMGKRRGL